MDLFITDETPNIELIITDENQEIVLQIADEEPPLQIFIDDHHGLSAYQLYLLVTTDNPPMTLEEWLESLAGGDLSGKANIDASNIDPHIPAWREKIIQEPEDPTEEQTASAPKARTEDGWRTIANTAPAFISLGNNPAGSFHLTGSSDVQGFITKQGKFMWPGREFVIKTDQAVTLKASEFIDTSNARHWTFAEDFALKGDSWAIIKEKAGELLVIEMGADVDLSPYALDADLDAEVVNRALADALKIDKPTAPNNVPARVINADGSTSAKGDFQLSEQIEISTNQTAQDAWKGKEIWVTASCTLTIPVPSALSAAWNIDILVFPTVTLTLAITSGGTWLHTTPATVSDAFFRIARRSNTTTFKTLGL